MHARYTFIVSLGLSINLGPSIVASDPPPPLSLVCPPAVTSICLSSCREQQGGAGVPVTWRPGHNSHAGAALRLHRQASGKIMEETHRNGSYSDDGMFDTAVGKIYRVIQ